VINALTKYIGGHGNALAGSITDTGRFDWTRFPNIAENYKSQPPAMWGIQQIRKKGLRDWGGTLAAGEAHPIAIGAETLALRMERTCANALALAEFLATEAGVRTVYYPGSRRMRSTRSRARCSARTAGSSRSSSRTASTASISSIGSTSSSRRRISATTGRSRFRSRTRSSGRWGRNGGRRWASPTA
jgi:O-acetylhomoserine/O-acetylserine sulfhydrylase-like pyridoxal-dependent enzyme